VPAVWRCAFDGGFAVGAVAFEAARWYDLPVVQSHCEAHTGWNGCKGAMRRSNLMEKGNRSKKDSGKGTRLLRLSLRGGTTKQSRSILVLLLCFAAASPRNDVAFDCRSRFGVVSSIVVGQLALLPSKQLAGTTCRVCKVIARRVLLRHSTSQ